MANDFPLIGSAIYAALGGGTASPAVHYAIAPQGSTPPYTIIQRMSGVDDRTFTDQGIDTVYVVKCISDRIWPGEAWLAYGTVHANLENVQLSIGGGMNGLRCQRQSTIEYQDTDRFWHVGGLYKIDIWEA